MSYIERDELIAKMQHPKIEINDGQDFANWYSHCIRTAPDADVAPPHGEWILVGTNEHDYETSVEEKCSLCGRYVYRYDTQPQDNYCPNCGAKMDKEAENERND